MFYELRRYRIFPGKMDDFIRLMDDEIIPFQVACGMVITGTFRGEADDSLYIWMRRFESEAERERLYAKVYESDLWKNDIGPRVDDLIDLDTIEVTRIVPTPRSVAH